MFTGFSILPLRLSSYLGFFLFAISIVLTAFFIFVRLAGPIFIQESLPPGWASTVVLITFFFGLQFMMMGMIGEYLGRLFLSSHGTPQFLIRKTYGIAEKEDNVVSV
jgi:undecaprenyl-phosphate 4-deoxy-4-formamido-L-arabinose transferase